MRGRAKEKSWVLLWATCFAVRGALHVKVIWSAMFGSVGWFCLDEPTRRRSREGSSFILGVMSGIQDVSGLIDCMDMSGLIVLVLNFIAPKVQTIVPLLYSFGSLSTA
ncbi:hypothetical protein FB446DRAFT_253247 [Lentinula raphanica]|nr:hypothetical protein FB446DRAFT_253247 [Lentinula raphanica]